MGANYTINMRLGRPQLFQKKLGAAYAIGGVRAVKEFIKKD
jgi:hypothetical protein